MRQCPNQDHEQTFISKEHCKSRNGLGQTQASWPATASLDTTCLMQGDTAMIANLVWNSCCEPRLTKNLVRRRTVVFAADSSRGHQECSWCVHGSCTMAVIDTVVVQRRISAKVCTGSSAAGATFTSSRKSAESNHATTVARIGQLHVARQKPPPTSTLWQSSLTRGCLIVLE